VFRKPCLEGRAKVVARQGSLSNHNQREKIRSEIMATAFAEETRKEVKKDVTSLRSALEWLDTQGDVLRTDVEVDPDLEISGVQKHLDG